MNINRILQKLIAGVICMGIIISTIPTVIEAEYDYTGIVNLTTSLNIIPEKIVSGDFVTRKELAKYICYMLNIEDQGTVYNGDSFYDVDKSNEYYDYICAVSGLGIMSGVRTNVFEPEKIATFEMVVRALVGASGYGVMADKNNTSSYVEIARSRGMLNKVAYEPSGYVKFGEIAQMIWNILQLKAVETSVGGSAKVKVSNVSLLWHYHRITDGRGRVIATDDTYLNKEESMAKGYVRIDDKIYKAGTEYINSCLGRIVNFYYKQDEKNDENIILWAEIKSEKAISLNADEIKETARDRITYEKNDKKKEVKLSDTVNVIYNGKYLARYRTEDLKPDIGNVTLIDYDENGVYETVIVKAYNTYVVQGIDKKNKKIYDAGAHAAVVINENAKISVKHNDAVSSFDDIEIDDVLLVAADRYEITGEVVNIDSKNSSVYEILISKNKISGRISEIDNIERTAVVDRVKYSIAAMYNGSNESTLDIGDEGTFFLDAFGGIAYLRNVDEISQRRISGNYGYVTKVRYNSEDELTTMRVFGENGEWYSYSFAKKVVIDGNLYKEQQEVYTILSADNSAKLAGGTGGQMIAYRLNNEGEVCFVDTVALGSENPKSSMSLENPHTKSLYYYSKVLGYRYLIDSKAKILSVPMVSASEYDPQSEKEYRWISTDTFVDGDSYAVQVYNCDDYNVAEFYVYPSSLRTAPSSDSPLMMISHKLQTIDEDNDVVTRLTLVNGDGTKKIDINNDTVVIALSDATSKLRASDLKVGDIIRFTANIGGTATFVDRQFTLYDKKGNITEYAVNYGNSSYTSSRHMTWGNLYAAGKTGITVLCSNVLSDTEGELMCSYLKSNTPVICYDLADTNEIIGIDYESAKDYLKTKSLSMTDKIFINRKFGNINAIFIYRLC